MGVHFQSPFYSYTTFRDDKKQINGLDHRITLVILDLLKNWIIALQVACCKFHTVMQLQRCCIANKDVGLFTFYNLLFTFHFSLFPFPFSLSKSFDTLPFPFYLFTIHFSLFTIPFSLFPFHYSLFTSKRHAQCTLLIKSHPSQYL